VAGPVTNPGRVALVTGASRGIGRAVAHRLAAAGARIAVHYRSDRTAAEATVGSLAGTGHFHLRADVADADAVQELVREVVRRTQRLDVLVNNAGIYAEIDVATASYDQWQEHVRRTLVTNLAGPAHLLWCAAQEMRRLGGGRIVNISSRGAFRGEPTAPAYAASKAGLNALGQSLAQAFGPHGVTVATVAPGFVRTDMTEEILAGPRGDAIRAQSPLGRVATVDEVAAAVAYLASDEAVFATGGVLDLNGASYLRT
jgi:3-oxoacyl-[acyl-carrier protein] reductase